MTRKHAAITVATAAGPVLFGLMNPQGLAQSPAATATSPPSFEVATIKPNRPVALSISGSIPVVDLLRKMSPWDSSWNTLVA